MVCYVNKGFILEQALAYEIESYFSSLNLDKFYSNFHVKVTNAHPFADLFLHTTLQAADTFPSIVVTTTSDSKIGEFSQLSEQATRIKVDKNDLTEFFKDTETIPGACTLVDDDTKQTLIEASETYDEICGLKINMWKTDNISIEIWADNVQLKNELYEQLRLFIGGNLINVFKTKYRDYSVTIFDNTIKGERSNNFNFDFGLILSGAKLSFDVDYCVSQIIFDTDARDINKIEWEVLNYVKKK